MGNFEKLSVLVIVVIIVMILVVALYTWSDNPGGDPPAARDKHTGVDVVPEPDVGLDGPDPDWKSLFDEVDPKKGAGGTGSGTTEDVIPEPPVLPEPDVNPAPQPAEPKPEPAAQEPWMYTVKDGDTLTEIAENELETWKRYREILKLNPGITAESLRKGQVLKMPPRVTTSSMKSTPGGKAATVTPAKRGKIAVGEWYVIRRGDRLSRISKDAYGTIDRWPELWARNLSVIDDPDAPTVGAKIFIPK